MKYYIDTEFQEGFHKPLLGKTRHFIDLISIGIVAEDGREYYAISKDFNLKSVWGDEWLRENVLMPIFWELSLDEDKGNYENWFKSNKYTGEANLSAFNYLVKKFGKTNNQIADDIKDFVLVDIQQQYKDLKYSPIEFYGYYADYDWVVFCSLFGRMIDLPSGFPMYCRDLKQMSDELYEAKKKEHYSKPNRAIFLNSLKDHLEYPRQTNEHNALADADWNKQLHQFILNLK